MVSRVPPETGPLSGTRPRSCGSYKRGHTTQTHTEEPDWLLMYVLNVQHIQVRWMQTELWFITLQTGYLIVVRGLHVPETPGGGSQ